MGLRSIILSCLVVSYFVVRPSPLHYNTICIGLILLFGVPHGAADYRINATIHKKSNGFIFIVKYLLVTGGYALWWIFMPGKAFILFLILSSYHFGQEFLENLNLPSSKLWEIMIWGSAILIAPVLIAFNEIKHYIEFISKVTLSEISSTMLVCLVSLLIIGALGHLYMLKKSSRISSPVFRTQLAKLIILILSFILLPFLVAFTIYFVLFHSLNSIKHQYDWLKSNINSYTLKSFMSDIFLFSLPSIVGTVLLAVFVGIENLMEMVGYFFIMISIITLPHSILFNQFYEFRNKQATLNNNLT